MIDKLIIKYKILGNSIKIVKITVHFLKMLKISIICKTVKFKFSFYLCKIYQKILFLKIDKTVLTIKFCEFFKFLNRPGGGGLDPYQGQGLVTNWPLTLTFFSPTKSWFRLWLPQTLESFIPVIVLFMPQFFSKSKVLNFNIKKLKFK